LLWEWIILGFGTQGVWASKQRILDEIKVLSIATGCCVDEKCYFTSQFVRICECVYVVLRDAASEIGD